MKRKTFSLNKKAVSHIEIILSMTIFVIFVFFVIYFLNPVRHQNIDNVLSSILQESIQKNTQVTLFETPLVLSVSIPTCFIVANPYSSQDVSVFDTNKNQIVYNKYAVSQLAINKGAGDVYYIYYSPDQALSNLEGTLVSCNLLNDSEYSFSSTRHIAPYSLKKLNEMKDKYNNDYNGLKEEFDFPLGSDFKIYINELGDNTKLVSMEKTVPEKVEVFATEIPIQIMKDSGEVSSAVLNIQVW